MVITIQSDLKAYGHYTAKKVWIAGEGETQTEYHEINLSAETLKRPYHATCATLMHEMIHHFCHCNGITDTSRQGRYHNKEFKRVAEEKGLIITYSPVIGWSVTEPSEKFKQYIDSLGIDFKKIYRDTEVKEPKAASQSTVYKYECPICGGKLRKISGQYGDFFGCSNYKVTGCTYKRKINSNTSCTITIDMLQYQKRIAIESRMCYS